MALLVWFMTGIALWHFTVFLPDRFWQGIVGAFLGAVTGAIVSGAVAQVAIGDSIGQTDLATMLFAVPGTALGLAFVYVLGMRGEHA
jgi:ABC-type Fe3+ transport system permease subunit